MQHDPSVTFREKEGRKERERAREKERQREDGGTAASPGGSEAFRRLLVSLSHVLTRHVSRAPDALKV